MQPWQGPVTGPGLTFPARPRFRRFALPPWILIAEAAEPRDHSHPTFFKREELAIFVNVGAKIADRTPGAFDNLRLAGISEVNADHNCGHQNNAQHCEPHSFSSNTTTPGGKVRCQAL